LHFANLFLLTDAPAKRWINGFSYFIFLFFFSMVLMKIALQLPPVQAFCSRRKAKSDCETTILFTIALATGEDGIGIFFFCINYKTIFFGVI